MNWKNGAFMVIWETFAGVIWDGIDAKMFVEWEGKV